MSDTNGQAGEAPLRNEEFPHNPRIRELDEELDLVDAERLDAINRAREKARPIKEERDRLIMEEQLTLRILADSSLSIREVEWIEANPDRWKLIKEATRGKRGSRRAQFVKAGPHG